MGSWMAGQPGPRFRTKLLRLIREDDDVNVIRHARYEDKRASTVRSILVSVVCNRNKDPHIVNDRKGPT